MQIKASRPIKLGLAVAVASICLRVWAADAGVYGIDIRGDGDNVRVQLETRVGVFANTTVTTRGNAVLLDFKGADRTQLVALIDQLKRSHPLIKSIRVLPGPADDARLLLEFSKPVTVLDETVVALPDDRSRWELVLAPGAAAPAVPAVSTTTAPTLGEIALREHDGRLDLALTGNADLIAEVSFKDKPARLMLVDLPGVRQADAQAALARSSLQSPLLRAVRLDPAYKDGARLVFELAVQADLVDSGGTVSGGVGNIRMSLVPDRAAPLAAATPPASPSTRLGGLSLGDKDGLLVLALSGTTGARVAAYTLEQPPRLVVDFLGWNANQINDAVAAMKVENAAVRGVHVDETRLGSARVIVDLAGPAPLAGITLIPATPARPEGAIVAIRKPDTGALAAANVTPRPLDLRYRPEKWDPSAPDMVIRPIVLDGARDGPLVATGADGQVWSLNGLFEKALDADAKYRAAKSDLDINAESIPQARAGILPVASFDFQSSTQHQNVREASNPSFPTGSTRYGSHDLTLTITQPLYRPQALVKMDQAAISVDQARLSLVAAEQDLILRVATSYLGLLAAQDGVELARAEREATEKQFDLAHSRLSSGLGTITADRETEGRFALTQAREIEAQNRLDDARLALKEIVGETVTRVKGFRADFSVSPPQPASVEPWVSAALEQNLALQTRNRAVDIAALEVRRQRAGYMPTVNLVGTVGRQDSGGSIYGAGQKVDNAELAVKLSMPLYEGGMTTSLVREATAREQKANDEREQEKRRTERLARSAFLSVEASAKTMGALRRAVTAQDSALEARLDGLRSGLYNIVAVVDAYRLYYAARRDYLQARYDYLVNRLKLKQAVGNLSRNDLADLGELLK